jgi:hypothetical protein
MSKRSTKVLVFIALLISIGSLQGISVKIEEALALPNVPYKLGNWTYIGKPISPISVGDNQIMIGANWTYVCNLRAGAKYHVYFYGHWIDPTPLAEKTDYDIYVYNPSGELESMHTESAGLPEHLGTTVKEPFFIPKYTGNYSFLIKNDAKESRGAKNGTFMIIEHLECNQWYQVHMQGKVNDVAQMDTCWAYEFTTTSGRVDVPVIVPDPPEAYLDMYEVQLYLMANPSDNIGTILNGMPLPWEPGLSGEAIAYGAATYGGYRLTAEGFYHANASASCEYYGQDMLIDYSSGIEDDNPNRILLYHLALIAEGGEGTVRFMFKTDFNPPTLNILDPLSKVYTGDDVVVTAYTYDNESGLENVTLDYTTNNWITHTTVEMTPSENNTYLASIPGQPAGKTVKYRVTAKDAAENTVKKESSYIVKNKTSLYVTLSNIVINGGQSIRVSGILSRGFTDILLDFYWQETHVQKTVMTSENGSFTYEYTPDKAGNWTVTASWSGNNEWWEVSSESSTFSVQKILTSITCNIARTSIIIGENVDITGFVVPSERDMRVVISLTEPDGTIITREVYTSSDGSYGLMAFQPNLKGQWQIRSSVTEDEFYQPSNSNQVSLIVGDTWLNEYKLYIIAIGGIAGVVAIGLFLFFRNREVIEEEE